MAGKKQGGGAILGIISVLLIVGGLNILMSDPNESDGPSDDAVSPVIETAIEEIPPLRDQIKALGGSEVYLNTDASILEQCGVDDVRKAELVNDTGDPSNIKTYRIVYDEDRIPTMTFEKGSLYHLGFNGTDLYTTTEGVIMKMQDVHVPITEVPFSYGAQLQMICEDVIKKYLNFPATADFHALDWAYGREDNNYMVQGSVTASNAFGVKEKMQFTVWLEHDPDADEMTPTGVSLNGNIVYQK